MTFPNEPLAAIPPQAQTGELTLTLETHGLGCSRVHLPAAVPAARLPFRLGPLECSAYLGVPSVQWGLNSGMTTTRWPVRLVGVPEGFAVADLLEALGAEVTR